MEKISAEHIRRVVKMFGQASQRTVVSRDDLIHAAVLVPIVMTEGDAELLLTQRTDRVETHKGQIAFPGGMVDSGDRDREHTALREAEEELGIVPSAVELCGILDDLATPTGFVITPIVGLLTGRPAMHLNEDEVAEAFFVPLSFFCRPDHVGREFRNVGGERREVWTYYYDGRRIWGATAAVIRHLVTIVTTPGPNLLEQTGRPPYTPSGGHSL